MITGKLTDTQAATINRIASTPAAEQPRQLLKWALARLTYYGPSDEPCAQVIQQYLDTGEIKAV